jgi:hypothetical protein
MGRTAYRTVDVNGLSVFYREAGPQDAPAILLLEVHVLDAGHFALDEQPDLIADLTRSFLQRRGDRR